MNFRLRPNPRRAGLVVLAMVSLAALSATPALARPSLSTHLSTPVLSGVTRAASGASPTSQLPVAGPVIQPVPGPPIGDLPVATPADFAAQPPVPEQAFVGQVDPNAGVSNVPVNAVLVAPPSGSSVIQATGVTSTFPGQSQGTKGGPSDSGAAGGPSNVLEQVNGGVAVYSRTGKLVEGPVTSAQWYGVPSSDKQFDPHTIFDPNGYQFITMMADGTKHSWMVSVTTTSDATSSRCTYTIDAANPGETSVDFPLMAVSPKYLMLTMRELNTKGNRLVVMSLAQVEACQGAATWFWANVQNPGGGTADTLTPVLDYNLTDTYSYLVSSYGGGGSNVSLYKFSDSGSSPGGLVSASVSVPHYAPPPSAPQKGSSVVVETGNSSITQAVNYYSGTYATLTTGYSGAAAVMWLQLNLDTQKLLGNGLLYNPALPFFDSSITEGSNGNTMYTYALAGKTIYPSSALITMDINHNILSNGYIKQGAYPSPVYRWGDFTTTYTDYSVNTNAFWSASQFQADASHYGTVIAYGSA